jgi:hypothetical protein
MSFAVPTCQKVLVYTFRGERGQYAADFLRSLDAERTGGARPSHFECLRYAGHTGVSIDLGKSIYSFNPDGGGLPVWELFARLKNHERFHGVVLDDTFVFKADAPKVGLTVLVFEIILPDPEFQQFAAQLWNEFRKSRFWYGFPNGDGDCNCTTWLERMGLPLLTGRIDEFVDVFSVRRQSARRFGKCV